MNRRVALIFVPCLLWAVSASAAHKKKTNKEEQQEPAPAAQAPAAAPAPAGPAAAPAPAAPVDKPLKANSVAVMDTVAQGVPDALAALTTQTISSYAQNNLGMDVVSKDDVKRFVSFDQMRQVTGCDTGTCAQATDLGKLLGVQEILTSTIGKIGDRYQITIVAMDTVTAKALGRGTREVHSEDEIVENVRDLTHFALKHEQRESKGYVRIAVVHDGTPITAAQIAIDGSPFGVSPLTVPARLLAGTHRIHVEKDGYLPFDASIDVEAGKEAGLDAKLIAKADIKVAGAGFLPWAGATGGLAIAGTALSIVAYYHALNICKAYSIDSSKCLDAGKDPQKVDYTTLNNRKNEVDLWGNKIAFYGAIGSGVLGAASVALFTTYFIVGRGSGSDEPGHIPVTVTPTGDGFAVHF